MGDALRPGGLALTERALALCRLPESGWVADVGCGWGETVRHLRIRGYRAVGVDLSAEALLEGPCLSAVRGTALALPVGSETLDGIFCECVLSLLSSPESAILEFHRTLKPGGYLVLTDVYLREPSERPGIPVGSHPSCLAGAVGIDERVKQVRKNGFQVLKWEDHSRLLAELAARIVWGGGSLDAGFLPPSSCRQGAARFDLRRARPGYFLLVARKNEKEARERPDP